MTNFSLKHFSFAFSQIYKEAEDAKDRKKFLVFAFILATTSNKNIFPDLLSDYQELNVLTSRYILVVSPYFALYKDRDNKKPLTPEEISRVLRTKKFDYPSVFMFDGNEVKPEEIPSSSKVCSV